MSMPYLACALSLSLGLGLASAGSGHDRGFWRAIVDADYAVPEGASVAALLAELHQLLGSPDTELRDGFGYGITAAWVYRDQRLSPPELRDVVSRLTANLRSGIGEVGTDSILLRSFSALDLSILAAQDNKEPYLEKSGINTLLDAALDYLAQEKDHRDWDSERGWMHAAAHTADLLKFLARSRHLEAAQQQRILEAIATRLETVGSVYTHGEDERLARVALSLINRADFDAGAFDRWLEGCAARAKGLWAETPLDHARYVAVQNRKNLLKSLAVLLSTPAVAGGAAGNATADSLAPRVIAVAARM